MGAICGLMRVQDCTVLDKSCSFSLRGSTQASSRSLALRSSGSSLRTIASRACRSIIWSECQVQRACFGVLCAHEVCGKNPTCVPQHLRAPEGGLLHFLRFSTQRTRVPFFCFCALENAYFGYYFFLYVLRVQSTSSIQCGAGCIHA